MTERAMRSLRGLRLLVALLLCASLGCAGTSPGGTLTSDVPPRAHRAVEAALRAHLHMLHQEPELALAALQEAQAILDREPTLALLTARVHLHLGDTDNARRMATLAERLGAPEVDTLLLQISIDEAEEAWVQAIERLEPWLTEEAMAPHRPWARIIELAERAEDRERALQLAYRWTTAEPDRPEPLRRSARLQSAAGDSAAAARLYQRAAETPAGEPSDHEQSITAWRNADATDLAVAAAVRCLDRFPGHWPCAVERLALLDGRRATGERVGESTEEAILDLARRAQGDPQRFAQMTDSAARRLREDTQLRWLRETIARAPEGSGLFQQAAYAAWRMERIDDAVDWMSRYVEHHPSDAEAHNFIGYLLADANRELSRAAYHVERAHELAPDALHILDSVAWLRFRQGRLEEALSLMQRVLAEAPTRDAIYLHHLASIHAARREYREADRIWREALERVTAQDRALRDKIRAALDALSEGRIHELIP